MRFYIKADITDYNDESFDTQVEIAGDPNTRPAKLRHIWEATNSSLRDGSRARPFTYVRIYFALAGNPSTPVDILEEMTTSNWRYYWPTLATNPSVPEEYREKFLLNPSIAHHIAENMNTTTEQLAYMLDTIYAHNAQNSVLSTSMLIDLICHDNLPQQYKDKLYNDYDFKLDITIQFTTPADEDLPEDEICVKVERTLKQLPEVGDNVLECALECLGEDDDPAKDRWELYIYCNLFFDSGVEQVIVNTAEDILSDFGCDDFDNYGNPYVT